MHDTAHVVDDDIARPSQQRPHVRSIATVVRALVVGTQGGLIAPRAEEHKLAAIIARKDAELDAPGLGTAGVRQLREEGAQLVREANASVDIGNEHNLSRHRDWRF
jgi:hypothetical protein